MVDIIDKIKRLIEKDERTQKEIAEDAGIHHVDLNRWLQRRSRGTRPATIGSDKFIKLLDTLGLVIQPKQKKRR